MNDTQLRSFDASARYGGFTKAARAIRVSQPTITSQVRQLELDHNVELFARQGRNIVLTPLGEELYELTSRIAQLKADALTLLEAHNGHQLGHLRLAAVGPFHATDVLVAFKSRHPNVKISVLLGNSTRTLARLFDFSADVAMIAEVDADPRVEMIPFSRHRVVIFVHAGHPWFGRESIRLCELQGQDFVYRETGSTTRLAFEAALRRTGVSVNPVVEIGSREAVWKAVEQGIGIGAVADFEFVPHPRLRTVRISDAEIITNYNIAYLKERRESPLIRTLVDIARNVGSTELA